MTELRKVPEESKENSIHIKERFLTGFYPSLAVVSIILALPGLLLLLRGFREGVFFLVILFWSWLLPVAISTIASVFLGYLQKNTLTLTRTLAIILGILTALPAALFAFGMAVLQG